MWIRAGVAFSASTLAGWELVNVALAARGEDESVVVIAPPDKYSARSIASRLRGVYSTMEEVGGSFMSDHLADLTACTPETYAHWLATVAKGCFEGYAKVDATALNPFANGRTASDLRRPGLVMTLAALDAAVVEPTLGTLAQAMDQLRRAKEARLHSHEAWADMALAIDACSAEPERDLAAELGRLRDRVRRAGRRSRRRVVSRTVLIEYDHVIIANVDRIDDSCNLYVAISRARKTITVTGDPRR